jgi:hypothetical protein
MSHLYRRNKDENFIELLYGPDCPNKEFPHGSVRTPYGHREAVWVLDPIRIKGF